MINILFGDIFLLQLKLLTMRETIHSFYCKTHLTIDKHMYVVILFVCSYTVK